MITIENWSVVSSPSNTPYTAPECRKSCLHGNVYNHPKFEDGFEVTTSDIKKVSGRVVSTRSGSLYYLGNVSEDYEKRFPAYDLQGDNPIRIK